MSTGLDFLVTTLLQQLFSQFNSFIIWFDMVLIENTIVILSCIVFFLICILLKSCLGILGVRFVLPWLIASTAV